MPSKLFSRARNDTFESIIRNDTYRYVRQGYGLIVGILINVVFFFGFSEALKRMWPFLLENFSIFILTLTLVMSAHTLTYVVINLVMWFIYTAKWAVFEKDRISPHIPWPWEEKDPTVWNKMKWKSLRILLDHHFIIVPLLFCLDYYYFGCNFRLDVDTLPSLGEIIFQIVIFMISDDFFFYWGHRLLHHPKLYPYIHKLHHEHYNPLIFSGEYDHPIEFAFGVISGNFLPKFLGLKVHFITNVMWVIVRTFEVLDDHCGYEFSWSPFRLVPFSGSASYHNFHHTHNIGNYATFFTLWDTANGTNKAFYQFVNEGEKKRSERIINQRRLENEKFLSLGDKNE